MRLKVLDGRVLPSGGKIDLPMRGQVATNARSEYMWKVGDVEPVRSWARKAIHMAAVVIEPAEPDPLG